jgi:hypothetical protein
MDRSTWPVVTVTFLDRPTDEEFEAYLRELEALYENEEPFGLVFDARNAAYLPRSYRQRQADWIDANRDMIERYLAGTAYVIDSVLLRNVLRAIFALQEQPVPYTVEGAMQDAYDWVGRRLEEKGGAE